MNHLAQVAAKLMIIIPRLRGDGATRGWAVVLHLTIVYNDTEYLTCLSNVGLCFLVLHPGYQAGSGKSTGPLAGFS